MNTLIWKLCVIWGIMLVSYPLLAENDWSRQRVQFQEAQQAIASGNTTTLAQLKTELQTYPIVYYLDYQLLSNNLDTADPTAVTEFLNKFKETAAADKLRAMWLLQLAIKKDWAGYLNAYTPQKDKILQCNQLTALVQLQKKLTDTDLEQAKTLWSAAVTAKDCDPIFQYLQNNKLLSNALLWERIRQLMSKKQSKAITDIAKLLPKSEQLWVGRWMQMLANPDKNLKKLNYPHEPFACEILLDGIQQLAPKNASSAYDYLKKLATDYQCSATAKNDTLRTIALQAAQQKLAQAADWLAEIDAATIDETVRQVQLQVALAPQHWELLAKFIQHWSAIDQKTPQAQYWLGRALEQMEQLEQAKQLYREAAQDRGFYGFLAADRLKQPYQFNIQAITVNPKETETLLKNPAVIRAREFFLVGLNDEARQEWQAAIENLSPQLLEAAAQLASEWNWYYQAIVTASRANALDDVKLRFPTPFYDTVLGQAQTRNLDSAWVYAVIRQESAFRVDARSRANALGLMQLLPATAKELATKEQLTLAEEKDIFVPETNIRLGVLYLRQLLDRFDDNYVLASASYNAGASRVRNWVKTQGCVPMDAWIELIPFKETRKYVQAILSYTPIFEYRLTGNTKVQSMHVDELDNESCQGSV